MAWAALWAIRAGGCPATRCVAAGSLGAPPASADGWGVLLDYAAGVIPASQIRAAGAAGSIRYVSDRRPGGNWMLGKPMQISETPCLKQNRAKASATHLKQKERS